jgi:hypothetical protein
LPSTSATKANPSPLVLHRWLFAEKIYAKPWITLNFIVGVVVIANNLIEVAPPELPHLNLCLSVIVKRHGIHSIRKKYNVTSKIQFGQNKMITQLIFRRMEIRVIHSITLKGKR